MQKFNQGGHESFEEFICNELDDAAEAVNMLVSIMELEPPLTEDPDASMTHVMGTNYPPTLPQDRVTMPEIDVPEETNAGRTQDP